MAASSPPADWTFNPPAPLPLALVAVVVAADTPGELPAFDDGGGVVVDVCVEFPDGVPVGVYLTPE